MIEEGELSDESKSLWAGLGNSNFIDNLLNPKVATVVKRKSKIRVEELKKLVDACDVIVRQNEELTQHWTIKEQYFKANESKVTHRIHLDISNVLKRILSGGDFKEQKMIVVDDTMHVI